MILSDQFSMQARMIQALDTGMELVPATQFGAFAMQSISPVNSSAVHVEINNNRTGSFTVLRNIHCLHTSLLSKTESSRNLCSMYCKI